MPSPAYNASVKTLSQVALAMGISSQFVWVSLRGAHGFLSASLRLLAFVLAASLLFPPSLQAGQLMQFWLLQDRAGHPWSLTLLDQADPHYPPGQRLRLTDRSNSQRLDHSRPLHLRDTLGHSWELANCSIELVPTENQSQPEGSAQFDLMALVPSPRSELPLAFDVPLEGGGSAQLVLGASAVEALHEATT